MVPPEVLTEIRELLGPTGPKDPRLPVPDERRPRAGVRVARRRRLHQVAAVQGGCFTFRQAEAAGLDRRARHHHQSYGNWRPTVAPGVHRLAGWPDDAFERLHAWLLWAGPGFSFTSWTALELWGSIVVGPRAPVHLSAPGSAWRVLPSPLRPLDRACAAGAVPVRRHRVRREVHQDVVLHGFPVRPIEEAACVAMMTTGRSLVIVELIDQLMSDGRLDRSELLRTASVVGATRVMERWFRRVS